MATFIVNVADLKPEGSDKTYRQLNAEKVHNIKEGSLVKILRYNSETEKYEDHPQCLVLYVVKNGRDCDETPLYWLSHQTLEDYVRDRGLMQRAVVEVDGLLLKGEFFGAHARGGYSEESLQLIATPEQLLSDD